MKITHYLDEYHKRQRRAYWAPVVAIVEEALSIIMFIALLGGILLGFAILG